MHRSYSTFWKFLLLGNGTNKKKIMSAVYFPQTNKPMLEKEVQTFSAFFTSTRVYKLTSSLSSPHMHTQSMINSFSSHTHSAEHHCALLKTSPLLKYLCHCQAGSQWISLHTNLATFQRDRREAVPTSTCVGDHTTVRQLERLKVTSGCSERTAILLLKYNFPWWIICLSIQAALHLALCFLDLQQKWGTCWWWKKMLLKMC